MKALSDKITSGVDDKVVSRYLHEEYWFKLFRQSFLYTGVIKPARVKILDNVIPSSTLSLPIYMCGPYGSNYDGYERLLYKLYSRELVRECESLKCDCEIIESPHMAHSSDVGYAPN